MPEAGSVMSLSTSFPVGIGRAIRAAARTLIVSDTAHHDGGLILFAIEGL